MAPPRRPQADFTRLRGVNRDRFYVGSRPDDWEGAPFTAICLYDSGRWSADQFDFNLASLALFDEPGYGRILYVLSRDGTVMNIRTRQREAVLPADAPVQDRDLCKIRQIGATLFASGSGGQVYRREPNGLWQRILDPHFQHLRSLLEDYDRRSLAGEFPKTPEGYRRSRIEFLKAKDNTLWGLSGLREDDFYVCSERGTIFHYDGTGFSLVPMPPPVPAASDGLLIQHGLLDILVERPDRVWACGREGTLLVGNREAGFSRIPYRGRTAFNGMALFQGKLYLSTTTFGLFACDGTSIERVESGLTPEIEDIGAVDAVDGVLWAMGQRDLLRFDGETWRRFDFPGNDPIR